MKYTKDKKFNSYIYINDIHINYNIDISITSDRII